MKNVTAKFGVIFWTSVLFSIVFVCSDVFFDSRTVPKWITMIVSAIAIIVFNAVRFIVKGSSSLKVFCDMEDMLTAISLVLSALSIYGIIQYHNYSIHIAVTGSYDNPAGFAATLSAGLPFVMIGMRLKNKYLRSLHSLTLVLLAAALLLSGSRAGLICLGLMLLLGGNSILVRRTWLKWALGILWLIFFVSLMFVKTDSAAGRLLIWTCCLHMMKGHWLFGYGPGGFESHYMDFQAAYLAFHPDSPYAMFADTVQYPFNEYLNILTDYGMAGLSLVLLFIGYMVYRYFRNRTIERLAALLGIVSVATFALFSYPLMYPFVWFILIYSSAVLLSDVKFSYGFGSVTKKLTACAAIVGCLYFGYRLFRWVDAEISWKRVSDRMVFDETAMYEYEKVYDVLYGDRFFMYNYSYALYRSENYGKGYDIASECRELWADYDLELLLGMLSEKLCRDTEAVSHYKLASNMCPNRLRPLYLLMKLYDRSGMPDKALCYAKRLCYKPIKIPSDEIARIKRDAEEYMKSQMNY